MPQRNPTRSIGAEANLAERIRRERAARGWAMSDLAQRMTEAGCPIQKSAISRIEDGNPPRTISLDETVALAKVFDVSLEDLLQTVESVRVHRAQQLLAELEEVESGLPLAVKRVLKVADDITELARWDEEVLSYVLNQRGGHPLLEKSMPILKAILVGLNENEDDELLEDLRIAETLERTFSAIWTAWTRQNSTDELQKYEESLGSRTPSELTDELRRRRQRGQH